MTPRQAEALRLQAEGLSRREIGERMGISMLSVKSLLERGRKCGQGVVAAMERLGVDESHVRGGWLKDRGASIQFRMPELPDDTLARIRAAFEGMDAAKPVPAPEYADADLLTVYMIADAHIGMLSWGRETGEDYDTDKAVSRIRDWTGRLVASSPASREAVILDVGDTLHADDQNNVTPKSRHQLDVDGRFFKTLEASITALSSAVELALAKHEHVQAVILPGNHSPHSYMAIMFALSERYRDNPRVTVRKEPGEFWIHRFGRNLLAAHHGDKAPPQRIVLALADDHAEAWGQTRHRFLWTGHLHSLKAQDIGGVQWEQLRAVTARDAYSVANAYCGRAQMQAVTLHREAGEVQRAKVAA